MVNAIQLLLPGLLTASMGLLGVFIGAVITAGSSYLLDRKREIREREREKRERDREIKRAARLLHKEYAHAAALIQVSAQQKRYCVDELDMGVRPFSDHYPVIAPELSLEDWTKISLADMAFQQFAGSCKRLKAEVELIPEEIKFLNDSEANLDAAREALSKFL
jgi:hypothetical protein